MSPTSHPTGRAARFAATTTAGALLLVLLVTGLFLVLFVGSAAGAQATPEGTSEATKVGDGEAWFDGAEVYLGDPCAKAKDVVAGGCDEEEGGGDPQETTSPDSVFPGSTALENTSQETTVLAEETAGFEATSPETSSGLTAPGTAGPRAENLCPAEPSGGAIEAGVARAVDGDTLELAEEVGGTTQVRLIVVDSPELESEGGAAEPNAEEAATFTAEALEGEEVLLEVGEGETDDYGRLLAYVWTAPEDGLVGRLERMVGLGGTELFNRTLLEEGYAEALPVEPNDLYAGCFEAAEQAARDAQAGIWGTPEGSSDEQYGEQTGPEMTAEETHPEGTIQEETVLQETTGEQTLSEETTEPSTPENAAPEVDPPDQNLEDPAGDEPTAQHQYWTETVPTEDTGSVPDYEKCDAPTLLSSFSGAGQQTETVEVPGGSFLMAYETEAPSPDEAGLFLLDVYGPGEAGNEPVEEISYDEVGTARTHVEGGPGEFTLAASAENRPFEVAIYGCGEDVAAQEPAAEEPVEQEPAQYQYTEPPVAAEDQAALPITQQATDAPLQETAYGADLTQQAESLPSYAARPDSAETSASPPNSLPTQDIPMRSTSVLPETGGASLLRILFGASCLAGGSLIVALCRGSDWRPERR